MGRKQTTGDVLNAVRERVLRKNVEAPDLATVKDFLRFHVATSKNKIQEEVTCDSLNTFAEWFFAGFSRVTDTPTNDDDRREIYDISTSSSIQLFMPEHIRHYK